MTAQRQFAICNLQFTICNSLPLAVARCIRTAFVTGLVLLLCVVTFSRIRAADETLSADELALIKQAETARVQTIEKVYGSVVAIYGNNRRGGGSGVLFDSNGFALTNHHVVAAAGTEGWAGLADGKLYRWKLVGTDPGGDVAIIQLAGRKRFPVAPLGLSDLVRAGDFAMAMGNPFVLAEDQKPTVTLGIVSGTHRYQPGSSKNMLVYGNCIQVDSSINPGNSGGPLFNMRGEVIGINGRGSFKERGRVNVGLGYAISMKQIKNFLPDLLATKIAQHGTLDVQFSNREAGVICDAINLDSSAARAGLKLGDRLVSFEGETINNANEMTNLVSTLPTGWPVEVVYERDGHRDSLWVRLTPLPYPKPPPKPVPKVKQVPKAKPKPVEAKKPGRGDKEKQKSEPAEKPKPAPTPRIKPPANRLTISNPNTVRDKKLNRQNARHIISRWQSFTGTARVSPGVKAFRIRDDVVLNEAKIGRQEILLATDGRFHVRYTVPDKEESIGFDGKQFFRTDQAQGKPRPIEADEALASPFVWQAAVLASVFREQPLAEFETVLLDGGDKAGGRRAYRLRLAGEDESGLFVWLSLFDDDGQPQVRLLKTGHDVDSIRSKPSIAFSDWRPVAGIKLPFRRSVVTGLSENSRLELVTTDCQQLESLPDALKQSTKDVRDK